MSNTGMKKKIKTLVLQFAWEIIKISPPLSSQFSSQRYCFGFLKLYIIKLYNDFCHFPFSNILLNFKKNAAPGSKSLSNYSKLSVLHVLGEMWYQCTEGNYMGIMESHQN